MTGFIDRMRGGTKGSGQANGPENPSANLGPGPRPGPLSTGKLIGAGGEGEVYEDRSDPTMVIKVLHPQHATPERAAKLQAMCTNPPQDAREFSWPNMVETDSGGLHYRMPKASGRAGTAYRFISANERRQLPQHQQNYEYRANIGVRIAEAFRRLHAIHVRIGDVNPSNILVSDDGSVMLIDCDSFQIPGPPGHQPYPCVVGSPEYTAPEIDDFRRQFRSQDSDNFALAVLLYQLLSNGSHPYQGIDASPGEAVSNIRERIKDHRFAHQPRGGSVEAHAWAGEELAHHARASARRLPAGLFSGRFPHRSSHRRCLGQHPGTESRPGGARAEATSAACTQGVGCAAGLAGGVSANRSAPSRRPTARAGSGARSTGSAKAVGLQARFSCNGEVVPEVQEPRRPAAPGLAQALPRAALPELQRSVRQNIDQTVPELWQPGGGVASRLAFTRQALPVPQVQPGFRRNRPGAAGTATSGTHPEHAALSG